MGWSHDKLRFSCVDSVNLKQLWKLIAIDTTTNGVTTTTSEATKIVQIDTSKKSQCLNLNNNNTNRNNNYNDNQNSNNGTMQRHKLNEDRKLIKAAGEKFNESIKQTHMSLLKFLAINALELSAPATPVLLQQKQQEEQEKAIKPPIGWLQLSGHPESIVPTSSGVVRKRVATLNEYEVLAYQQLSKEVETKEIIPKFYGTIATSSSHECFIELQDLLAGFKDPCVMDIKMGCRTFLEAEVNNKVLRSDLYQKMLQIDKNAPTQEEHEAQAITKLRYMMFREAMSSSMTKGFRIEALRLRGKPPIKDLKMIRTNEQIHQTLKQFIGKRSNSTLRDLIKRLKEMRKIIENSRFFQRHEIVGSSIFIVYDENHVGCWMIDFAKSRPLPNNIHVDHRTKWLPGNREEGLLLGFDNLIQTLEDVYSNCHANGKIFSTKCLQML